MARISSSAETAARVDQGLGLRVVVHRLLVQEIEAQEGAHPLVERLLVDDRAGSRTPPRAAAASFAFIPVFWTSAC